MGSRKVAMLALLALLHPLCAVAAPEPGLYRRAVDASLEVLVDDHLSGSGFVVDAAGLAITAAHVVPYRDRRIEVLSPAFGRAEVKVLAIDRGHDVALLRLPARPEPYAHLQLAERRPGATADVYLLGAPIYRHQVLLRGFVARDDLTYEFLPDEQYYLHIVHLSAPSPPGTSGGPWMDEQGRVVGLQSGLMHDSGSPVGIAYMAPVEAIRSLVERKQDAASGSVDAAFEEIWEHHAEVLARFPPRTEGLLVAVLRPGGAASRAGIRLHDLVTHVDGKQVRLRDELMAYLRERGPGQTVRLRVLRGRTEPPKEIAVKLTALEAR